MLFILIALTYFVVGVQFSRTRYARLAGNADERQRRSELRSERKAIKSSTDNTGFIHKANCRSHEWSSEGYRLAHCNCGVVKRSKEIKKELAAIVDEPSVMLPLVGWPVYLMESYLKGAKPKRSAEDITAAIERQERELGIS